MKTFLAIVPLVLCASVASARDGALTKSILAAHDFPLNTDPSSPQWRSADSVYAAVDEQGHVVPGLRTEIRSRWTKDNIYFLFICPYKHLYVKPDPDAQHETYELWNWNVAEVFIGTDFKDIKLYKEFEVSPQNEWIDLDINLHTTHHEEGWKWNSGFGHAARIDESRRIWYVAMKVPFAALGAHTPTARMTFRVNFYRTDGSGEDAKELMWQPVMGKTFHVPERFGLLKLVQVPR